jgi:hypothetical protein
MRVVGRRVRVVARLIDAGRLWQVMMWRVVVRRVVVRRVVVLRVVVLLVRRAARLVDSRCLVRVMVRRAARLVDSRCLGRAARLIDPWRYLWVVARRVWQAARLIDARGMVRLVARRVRQAAARSVHLWRVAARRVWVITKGLTEATMSACARARLVDSWRRRCGLVMMMMRASGRGLSRLSRRALRERVRVCDSIGRRGRRWAGALVALACHEHADIPLELLLRSACRDSLGVATVRQPAQLRDPTWEHRVPPQVVCMANTGGLARERERTTHPLAQPEQRGRQRG